MKKRLGLAFGLATALIAGLFVGATAPAAQATTHARLVNPSTGLPMGERPTASQRAKALAAQRQRPAASFPPNSHLTYYGGPVMSNVSVASLLWAPDATDATQTFLPQVTGATSPNMDTWFAHVPNSAHYSWLNEYNTPVSGGTGQSIGYGNFVSRTTLPAAGITPSTLIFDSQIQQVLANALVAHQIPAPTFDAKGQPNTIYAVFFPKNVVINDGAGNLSGQQFCAYHSSFQVSLGVFVPYAVLPDPTSSGMSVGCGTGTSFQNLQDYTSHELVEATTDPQVALATSYASPLAWYDINNGEIGDICNASAGTVLGTDGVTYTAQTEWSNAAANCIVAKTTTAPGTISDLAAKQQPGNSAFLTWTPPSDGGSALLSYTIYRSTSPAFLGTPITTSVSPLATSYTDSGLVNGTTYYYRVHATNILGSGTDSNQASVKAVDVPQAPVGVGSLLWGAGGIQVYWSGSPGDGGSPITSWNIYRYDDAHPAGVLVGNQIPADPWYYDLGLTPGTSYSYAVTAVNAAGESARSSLSTPLAAQGTPTAPLNVTATVSGSGEVTITWDPPASDGGTALTSYSIYKSETAGDIGGVLNYLGTSPTKYVDTGLTPGTTEYYTITASNGLGEGAASVQVSVAPATTPEAPGAVTATALPGGAVQVSWDAAFDGGHAISGYTARAVGTNFTCETTGLTCTINGLTIGETYTFEAFATNDLGAGRLSFPTDAVIAGDFPAAPTAVTVKSGNKSVTVSWTAPTNTGGLAITSYNVTASPGGATCSSPDAPTCTITGLTNGAHYTFTVIATNSLGNSPASAISAAATPRTVPTAPRSLKATYAAGHKTTVSWAAPSSNGGATITAYYVRWSANGKTWTGWLSVGKKTSALHVGFKKGVKGYVQVVAANAAGKGAIAKLTVKPTK